MTHDVCDALRIKEPGRTLDASSISVHRDRPGLRATFDFQRRREGRPAMVVKPDGLDAPPTGNQASPSLLQWICRDITDPEKRLYWAGVVVCIGLFTRLFWNNLGHFYYAWTTDENYSHGFLVPMISLYFAAQVARGGPGVESKRGGRWLGSLLLVFALLMRLLTIPLPIPFLGDIAFLVGLAGLFTLLSGTTGLKRYWFSFFFLIFMVPLPVALYSKIASPLQLLASRVASTAMNATGVPVLCEGNRMTLPGGLQLFVAEACSGMRQLTGFLALTTAVAYLTTRPVWYRVIIIVAALPIALSANIARVMLTGYIMHFVNPQFALGTYHILEGLLMMGFGLFLLHCLCSILDHIYQILAGKRHARGEPDAASTRPLAVGSS
jgi:exosortase